MNAIEIALGISRINRTIQTARTLSRGLKGQVRAAAFELIAMIRDVRPPPRPAAPIVLGFEDLCALHAGYIEMLEDGGADRVDIVVSFNKTLRGLPARPQPPIAVASSRFCSGALPSQERSY